jgi:hypothetical protein
MVKINLQKKSGTRYRLAGGVRSDRLKTPKKVRVENDARGFLQASLG